MERPEGIKDMVADIKIMLIKMSQRFDVQLSEKYYEQLRFHEELLSLQQRSSVDEYWQKFQVLAASTFDLTDDRLQEIFINGLRDDIKPEVRSFKCRDLIQAMELAQKIEDRNRILDRFRSQQSSKPTLTWEQLTEKLKVKKAERQPQEQNQLLETKVKEVQNKVHVTNGEIIESLKTLESRAENKISDEVIMKNMEAEVHNSEEENLSGVLSKNELKKTKCSMLSINFSEKDYEKDAMEERNIGVKSLKKKTSLVYLRRIGPGIFNQMKAQCGPRGENIGLKGLGEEKLFSSSVIVDTGWVNQNLFELTQFNYFHPVRKKGREMGWTIHDWVDPTRVDNINLLRHFFNPVLTFFPTASTQKQYLGAPIALVRFIAGYTEGPSSLAISDSCTTGGFVAARQPLPQQLLEWSQTLPPGLLLVAGCFKFCHSQAWASFRVTSDCWVYSHPALVRLNEISMFEATIANGKRVKTWSRGNYRLGHRFDFFQILFCYFIIVGFYLSRIDKFVCLSESNMLVELLKSANIPSFLTAVFTPKDDHVLILVLEIAEMNEQKFSNTFLSSFVKEGVYFTIHALSIPEEYSKLLFPVFSGIQLHSNSSQNSSGRAVLRCLCCVFDTGQSFIASETRTFKRERDSVHNLAELFGSVKGLTDILQNFITLSAVLSDSMKVQTINVAPVHGTCDNLLIVEKQIEVLRRLFSCSSDISYEHLLMSVLIQKLQKALSSMENFPDIISHGFKQRNSFATVPNGCCTAHPCFKVQFVSEAIQVIRCGYEDKMEWVMEVCWIYGSVTQDILTGSKLHCHGWKSMYCIPKRPVLKGSTPNSLLDHMNQVPWWSLGFIEIFFSSYCPIWYDYGGRLIWLEIISYLNSVVYPWTSIPMLVNCTLAAIYLLTGKLIVAEICNYDSIILMALFISIAATGTLAVGGRKNVGEPVIRSDGNKEPAVVTRMNLILSADPAALCTEAALPCIGEKLHVFDLEVENIAQQAAKQILGVEDFILGMKKTARQIEADNACTVDEGEMNFKEEMKCALRMKKREAVSDFVKFKTKVEQQHVVRRRVHLKELKVALYEHCLKFPP